MAEKSSNSRTSAAFVVGALLGASVALLFAPQSGRRTRRNIVNFAEKAKNRAEAVQIELRQSIENMIDDASEKIREGLDRGVDWTEGRIKSLHGALEEGKKYIRQEIDKIQSA